MAVMDNDTRVKFFQKVLEYMALKPTYNRMLWLMAQSNVENTKALNNPLATTWNMASIDSGQTSFNSVNVRNYSTLDIGARATAQTLKQKNFYPSIYNALVNDSSALSPALPQSKLQAEYQTYGGAAGYWNALKFQAGLTALQDFVKKKWKPIAAGAGLLLGISCFLLLTKSGRKWIGLKN